MLLHVLAITYSPLKSPKHPFSHLNTNLPSIQYAFHEVHAYLYILHALIIIYYIFIYITETKIDFHLFRSSYLHYPCQINNNSSSFAPLLLSFRHPTHLALLLLHTSHFLDPVLFNESLRTAVCFTSLSSAHTPTPCLGSQFPHAH